MGGTPIRTGHPPAEMAGTAGEQIIRPVNST